MGSKHAFTALMTAIVALVIVLVTLVIFADSAHIDGQRTKRARYAACTTIRDETLRRDCITGPKWQLGYPH